MSTFADAHISSLGYLWLHEKGDVCMQAKMRRIEGLSVRIE